ncbi:MAG: Pfs, and Ankyrin domain protein [Gammaproteobacteria bacterium]|jgi:ankyrin repeat protein|nr:Pfs, and Ankyrin domain protein [Gammaproteobacteria bacterium]
MQAAPAQGTAITPETPVSLVKAIQSGDHKFVGRALNQGAVITPEALSSIKPGETPLKVLGVLLGFAAMRGEVENIDQLLDLGADVNYEMTTVPGQTPLYFATNNAHIPAINRLLAKKAHVTPAVFAAAISTNNTDFMLKILTAGAPVSDVLDSVTEATPDLIRAILLHFAAMRGELEVVKRLLALGTSPNAIKLTANGAEAASTLTAAMAHEAVTKLLLAAGAAINSQEVVAAIQARNKTVLDANMANGEAALSCNIRENELNNVIILLQAGASISDSAIAALSTSTRMEIQLVLLSFAVQQHNVNAAASILDKSQAGIINTALNGRTLLSQAIEQNNFGMVELLIKRGASPSLLSHEDRVLLKSLLDSTLDADGKTALIRAVEADDHKLAEILLHAGASLSPEIVSTAISKEFSRPSNPILAQPPIEPPQYSFISWLKELYAPSEQAAPAYSYGNNYELPSRAPMLQILFIFAALQGDVESLSKLISAGIDIRTTYGEHGKTALDFAVQAGQAEAIDFLRGHGALTSGQPMEAARGHLPVTPVVGDCFFDAVVYELQRQGLESSSATELRARAIAYLRAQPDFLRDHIPENETAEAYLARMSQSGVSAEGPIIEALAMVLNVHLRIANVADNGAGVGGSFININDGEGRRGIIGLRLENLHYQPLEDLSTQAPSLTAATAFAAAAVRSSQAFAPAP